MMNNLTTREKVLEILKEVKPNHNLDTVMDIIEGGYIDSFELMFLIATLNEKFDVEISIDEIIPENFNSVSAIATMVENLKKKN